MSDCNNRHTGGFVELVEGQTGLRIDTLTEENLNHSTVNSTVSLDDGVLQDRSGKRLRDDMEDMQAHYNSSSLKTLLEELSKEFHQRFDSIELALRTLTHHVLSVEFKVSEMESKLQGGNYNFQQCETNNTNSGESAKKDVIIVGMPDKSGNSNALKSKIPSGSMGHNVTLVALNTQDDYPNGSWLGDETNPERRVRVPIIPTTLLHINTTCLSAEKMALTLLDYLFDRDTQASSNLSGNGRYNKKRLDPLFVYGIRCHVFYHFGITENDWHRIKQNLDSKCRTAFRRKKKGLQLSVKMFKGQNSTDGSFDNRELDPIDTHMALNDSTSQPTTVPSMSNSHRIKDGVGEIQILHVTAEQLAELRDAQRVEILRGDSILDHFSPGDNQVQMAFSMISPDQFQLQAIKTPGSDIHLESSTSILPISPTELTGHLSHDTRHVVDSENLSNL